MQLPVPCGLLRRCFAGWREVEKLRITPPAAAFNPFRTLALWKKKIIAPKLSHLHPTLIGQRIRSPPGVPTRVPTSAHDRPCGLWRFGDDFFSQLKSNSAKQLATFCILKPKSKRVWVLEHVTLLPSRDMTCTTAAVSV